MSDPRGHILYLRRLVRSGIRLSTILEWSVFSTVIAQFLLMSIYSTGDLKFWTSRQRDDRIGNLCRMGHQNCRSPCLVEIEEENS